MQLKKTKKFATKGLKIFSSTSIHTIIKLVIEANMPTIINKESCFFNIVYGVFL